MKQLLKLINILFLFTQDYIRAGCVSPISENIIVSGGYDKKINMFDLRTKSVTLSVDHEAPVESLMFLPSGSLLISAGNFIIEKNFNLIYL